MKKSLYPELNETDYCVKYTPAESDSGLLEETATGEVRSGFPLIF
jgi:hypothetical protein